MISRNDVLSRAVDGALPLLTLDEFFVGNTAEGSLAPNTWGYGRPTLAQIHERLREVEAHPQVDWVRVQLHDETIELDEVAAESVAVCTPLDADALEALVDVGWMESDGVVEGYVVAHHAAAPDTPAGSRVWSITWD